MNQLPQITLLHGIHKNQRIVKILSPFDQSVINKLKESANARWSATMRCWYMGKQSFDLRYIQTFLRHESSKTTEIYTHVTKKSLAKIKSPLDTILSYK
ncbi:hypothetical protein MNBD_BACTEROID01-730 [hydrothermal vent metagenome]|uniref:Tyr recombinase domain-containing protein n=1 Tax=hydrothermal vent metagenome TaxID=652676 RepID=A0A3B0U2R5_9ZZZZ